MTCRGGCLIIQFFLMPGPQKTVRSAETKYGESMGKRKIASPCLLKTIMALLLLVWAAAPSTAQQRGYRPDPGSATSETAVKGPDGSVFLYFADPETGYLTGEARQMDRGDDKTAFYSELVRALISGPENDLMPTLPEETSLRALYATAEGTVYVDVSGAVSAHHPGGVRSEMLSVYSMVNTLVLNTNGIREVKILVDGNEAETLAGHVDISRPLKAQMLLVR